MNFNQLSYWPGILAIGLVLVCLVFIFWSAYEFINFDYELKGAVDIPFKITKIESANYEHLTFLATYVIPLISFNFDSHRYLIVLGFLLVIMGVIYVKTDLFYASPSLALLGFRIYKVDGEFKNNVKRSSIILISKEKLKNEDKVSYMKLDERIYYAIKEMK